MKKSIIASLFAVAALAPVASFAADGTITFNGAVSSLTCVINGGVPSFTVTLPTVSSSAFTTGSPIAGRTSFPINLTDCPVGGNVRAFFERGANDIGDGTSLKNNGTATNVGVQLTSYNGNPAGTTVIMGTSDQGGFVPVSGGAATLQYDAHYLALGGSGSVTSGSVTTSVTYTLEFQ